MVEVSETNNNTVHMHLLFVTSPFWNFWQYIFVPCLLIVQLILLVNKLYQPTSLQNLIVPFSTTKHCTTNSSYLFLKFECHMIYTVLNCQADCEVDLCYTAACH